MEQDYKGKDRLSKFRILKNGFFIFSAVLFSSLNAQQTYTFTTANAVGRFGPTQGQITTAYSTTNLNGLVTSTNGVQSFTVSGGIYRITAVGAHGGNNPTYLGGNGVSMQGDFTLPPNAVINILVGQRGEIIPLSYNGGGGGGSFVWVNGQTLPLVAAGGGGGGGAGSSGENAVITTSGTAGNPPAQGSIGTGGNGANPGGGGWFTNGANFQGGGTGCVVKCAGNTAGMTVGGASPATCIAGIGFHGCSAMIDVGDGGFGGGSGGNGNCSSSHGSGGGGGYSGGIGQAAGIPNLAVGPGGGGGGSYNAGTNQVNAVSTRTGDGIVIIQELCNISLTASGSNSLNPSICAGQNVTLTTDGISNYAWSTGNTTNSVIVVSPAVTTVYTLSAMSPANCVAAKSITVTVSSALPVLTITNTPNTLCLGKTATLTAGGAVSYTWTGGPGGVLNGQTFTPTATSGYTVTGQNGCGQSTASTTITIAPLPVTVASSSNNICSGSTAFLTATASVNGFTWMPGSLTGSNVLVSPLANTVYTLTASDGTCSGMATLTLTTKPIPTLGVVASATNVCEGALVTMTVNGAQTYTWASPSSNATSISVNPTVSTSYIVSGTNLSNCISAISQIIVTKPNPVVNVATNRPIVCEAGSATLTASGGAVSYVWVNGPATNTNVVNPTVNSTYTVTGTAANACSTDKTITVNVLSVSVAVSSASTTICEGQSAVLNASGATTYTWVGLGNFSSATVSPTLTTTYSVSANTTSLGITCPSTNSITINVNALPTVSVSATKTLVCRKDANVIITASGASTYSWSATLLTNTISVHPQSTTTYSVTGTDANGCQDVATLQIVVSPCTGIAELTGSGKTIVVYPNPSNGEFTVSCESDITLKLINELGQEISIMNLSNRNDHKVTVTGLANGVYFIVGQSGTEKVNQKIVVNK